MMRGVILFLAILSVSFVDCYVEVINEVTCTFEASCDGWKEEVKNKPPKLNLLFRKEITNDEFQKFNPPKGLTGIDYIMAQSNSPVNVTLYSPTFTITTESAVIIKADIFLSTKFNFTIDLYGKMLRKSGTAIEIPVPVYVSAYQTDLPFGNWLTINESYDSTKFPPYKFFSAKLRFSFNLIKPVDILAIRKLLLEVSYPDELTTTNEPLPTTQVTTTEKGTDETTPSIAITIKETEPISTSSSEELLQTTPKFATSDQEKDQIQTTKYPSSVATEDTNQLTSTSLDSKDISQDQQTTQVNLKQTTTNTVDHIPRETTSNEISATTKNWNLVPETSSARSTDDTKAATQDKDEIQTTKYPWSIGTEDTNLLTSTSKEGIAQGTTTTQVRSEQTHINTDDYVLSQSTTTENSNLVPETSSAISTEDTKAATQDKDEIQTTKHPWNIGTEDTDELTSTPKKDMAQGTTTTQVRSEETHINTDDYVLNQSTTTENSNQVPETSTQGTTTTKSSENYGGYNKHHYGRKPFFKNDDGSFKGVFYTALVCFFGIILTVSIVGAGKALKQQRLRRERKEELQKLEYNEYGFTMFDLQERV